MKSREYLWLLGSQRSGWGYTWSPSRVGWESGWVGGYLWLLSNLVGMASSFLDFYCPRRISASFKDRTSANVWQIDFTHSVIWASVGSLVRKASNCVTWFIWNARDAERRRKLTISWQMSQMRSFSWGRSSAAKLATTNMESKTKTWTHHQEWPFIQNSPSSCPSWRDANTQFKGTLVTSPISSMRPCFIVTRFSVEEYTGVIQKTSLPTANTLTFNYTSILVHIRVILLMFNCSLSAYL